MMVCTIGSYFVTAVWSALAGGVAAFALYAWLWRKFKKKDAA